jgi:hypothetical protein
MEGPHSLLEMINDFGTGPKATRSEIGVISRLALSEQSILWFQVRSYPVTRRH